MPRPDLPSVDLEAAREQWARWWRRCWTTDQVMVLEELSRPGLPTFQEAPALQELLRSLLEPAGRWSSERHEEHFDVLVERAESADDGLGDLVRRRERQLRRRARPFRLSITELPVTGKAGWRLGPEALVVSRGLVHDREAFLDFVRPAVEAVA